MVLLPLAAYLARAGEIISDDWAGKATGKAILLCFTLIAQLTGTTWSHTNTPSKTDK